MERLGDVQMVSITDISVEDGAQQMATSPDMEPYLMNAEAVLTGHGTDRATTALSELPLEHRYIFRIVTGLKQAFCDFDKSSVRADLSTMNAEEFDAVVQLIDCRVLQFAMLLRTVFGAEEMQRMLLDAVEIAKRY